MADPQQTRAHKAANAAERAAKEANAKGDRQEAARLFSHAAALHEYRAYLDGRSPLLSTAAIRNHRAARALQD